MEPDIILTWAIIGFAVMIAGMWLIGVLLTNHDLKKENGGYNTEK